MRVYGTSPLYNYVELIFRSKRLFIGSIIIATLATVFFYVYRSGNYTASTVVLLTGTDTPSSEDKEEKGTIQYKLNILKLDLRDPTFVKQALRDERLDQNMSGDQFDQFAKDVKEKISFAFENNVLEISCIWPDERAANIVNAIFGAYRRTVMAEETRVSTTNTLLVQNLLTDYTGKRNQVEQAVRDYESKHILKGLQPDPGPASNEYQLAQREVTRLQADKELATMRFGLLQDQFKHTPKTYEESVVRNMSGKDPQYEAAKAALVTATNDLADMKSRYTDSHPKVKAAQEKVDSINKVLSQFSGKSVAASKPGPIINETQAVNPAYIQLDNQVKQEEIAMKGLAMQLEQAQNNLAEAEKRAKDAPGAQYNYRRMTDYLGIYSSIQSNLAVKLEDAKMAEQRDKAFKMAEIKQVVKPEAEKENKGAKGMLILAAGPLIGLIIAFSFSLLAESMDHSLRTPLEIEKHLGKPVLAVLPRINTGRDRSPRRLGGDASRPTLPSS